MFSNRKSDALLAKIRNGNPMTQREKFNLIIGLSIPSMLAQITSVMMFFIDAAMVGHLGAEASASIGIVESTTWLMGSMLSALSIGFSVQVAHFIGANDFFKARQVFRHALICGLIFSLLMMTIGIAIHSRLPYWLGGGADIAGNSSAYFLIYSFALPFVLLYFMSASMLKSSGNMKIPSILSVVMCLLDVVFNYIFIYIFKLGVAGAALGTLLAYVVTVLPMVWQSTCKSKILALHLDKNKFRWNWAYVRNAAKISGPIALQAMLMSGAQVICTIIVAPLGNIAIAANSFAITVESLCYMPGYGIGDAASTLVGQTFGAGRKDLCKSFAHMTVGLGMAVMAFMGIIMYIFAPEMMSILSSVGAIQDLGAQCLRIEALAEPFFAASIVTYSVCVGAGDTLKPVLINLCTMWGIRLTIAYALASQYGLRGVWFAMAIELTSRGILFLVRLLRGKWLNAPTIKHV